MFSVWQRFTLRNLKIILIISFLAGVQTKGIEAKSLLPFKENVMNLVPVQIVSNIDQYYVKDKIVSDANIDVLLKSVAKDIVDALIQKHDTENKLTDIATKLLNSTDNKHPTNAIEIRRILEYISKKSAFYIESYASNIASQELKRLFTGLAHVSSEIAITAALKDISWADIISRKNAYEMASRRRRSIPGANTNDVPTANRPAVLNKQFNNFSTFSDNVTATTTEVSINVPNVTNFSIREEKPSDMYSVYSSNDRIPVKYINKINDTEVEEDKPFMNKTELDSGKRDLFDRITLYQELPKDEHYKKDSSEFDILYDISEVVDVDLEDMHEAATPSAEYKPTSDYLDTYFSGIKDKTYLEKDKRYQTRMKHLENKAMRAITYSGDVAFFTAATLIATRRTMTASLEVVMAVKMASDGVLDRKILMTSLARVAAQQAAKEAKNANSKAQACQKSLKQVMKYASQAVGAKSYGSANRVSIDTISLAAMSRSMASVALEVAMNTLFETNSLNE